MGIMNKNEIKMLVEFMLRNKISIYHACQLQDLITYSSIDGIISKSRARKEGVKLTPFTSDSRDEERGVNGMVYFNFSDFGYYFHNRYKATPNVYGPILLKFSPFVLFSAAEVSVTLTSVSDNHFLRERDSLGLSETVKLFSGRYIHKKRELEKIFKGKRIAGPEMNVLYSDQVASFKCLEEVICDPIIIGGLSLVELTKQVLAEHSGHNHFLAKERSSSQYILYNDLVCLAQTGIAGPLSQEWLETVSGIPSHIVENFFNYLRSGTLGLMEKANRFEGGSYVSRS